jgi:hypothetical protein
MRRRSSQGLVALVALALAGCATPAPSALPDGVTVSVYQTRFDYGVRQLEIKVGNGTDAAITVIRATFVSTRFADPAVWDRPQEVPPGSARDLRVQLPEPACDGGEARDTVLLELTLADGSAISATVVPEDEQGRVDFINGQDCLVAAVDDRAAITPPDALRWTPGAHAPALVELAVEPTGTGGLTIHYAKGTVLLRLVDETGASIDTLSIEGLPATIPLRIAPERCDAHAIAEDKRGTFFPLEVEAEDRSGTYYVAVSDSLRREIYAYCADYCDLPD